jgi:aspartate/tyrosine/aromatic aminotransferase
VEFAKLRSEWERDVAAIRRELAEMREQCERAGLLKAAP